MVVKKAYVPDRGDVVWLDFNPTRGHEQHGRRPALILSPRVYNAASGLAFACPITSQIKGYPFEVPIPVKNVQSAVLTDQLRSIDFRERNAEKFTKTSQSVLTEVQEYLQKLLLN
jgi:mRNA interferase MazF